MTVTRRCTRSGIAGASRSTRFRQAPIRQGRCGDDVRVTGSGGESSSGYALTDDFWLSFFETPGKTRSRAALDSGIALLDTGDFYGAGPNELLLKRALEGRSEKPLLSVKFGAQRSPDGPSLGSMGDPPP